MLILPLNRENSHLFVQMFQFCFGHRVPFNQASYVLLSDSLKKNIHNHYVNIIIWKVKKLHISYTTWNLKGPRNPKTPKADMEMPYLIVTLKVLSAKYWRTQYWLKTLSPLTVWKQGCSAADFGGAEEPLAGFSHVGQVGCTTLWYNLWLLPSLHTEALQKIWNTLKQLWDFKKS